MIVSVEQVYLCGR